MYFGSLNKENISFIKINFTLIYLFSKLKFVYSAFLSAFKVQPVLIIQLMKPSLKLSVKKISLQLSADYNIQ